MSRIALICIALALCTAPLGGCSTAVIAAAGATAGFGLAQGQAEAFMSGELTAARLVSMESGEQAVLDSLVELHVPVKVHKKRDYEIYIMAKADGGPELRFTIKYISPVATKFEVRVGMLGDQATSRLLLARVDAMLGIAQPATPVEIVAPQPRRPPPEPDLGHESTPPTESKPERPKSTPPSEPP